MPVQCRYRSVRTFAHGGWHVRLAAPVRVAILRNASGGVRFEQRELGVYGAGLAHVDAWEAWCAAFLSTWRVHAQRPGAEARAFRAAVASVVDPQGIERTLPGAHRKARAKLSLEGGC